ALGMKSNEEILRTFYQVERISLRDKELFWNVSPGIVDRKLAHEIRNPKSDEVIVGAHKRITETLFKELIKAKISQVRASLTDLEGAYSVADVVNRQTGEIMLEANKPLTADLWQAFAESGITEVDVFFPDRDDIGVVLSRTLDKDAIRTSKEALIEIYRKPRPRGRRVAREPVPHRPGPDGARHQGKDECVPGNVHGHAARPGERQAGHGRDPRVLRLVAAQPVHGSDQPAQRNHAQAAPFGPRARRSVARTRRIRSPRRAPDALRPHLPD